MNDLRRTNTLEDFKKINFDAIRNRIDDSAALAEVLVKGHIPAKFLKKKCRIPKEDDGGWVKNAMESMFGAPAKAAMQNESMSTVAEQTEFLPSARAAMVKDDEIDIILRKSYFYQ